ncbi:MULTISPECIES: single-stranded-DNA-specific exonuclease RecJ [Nitrosomonas]|nr:MULTISPECIES: single-stranded-DNA-specific exonuclease RecJ [Nitrosomonas]MXS80125.1 single-stranded-DNA-specific exonuclease RecJ [Nitrosomonas sp. GH22]PXV84243.1 exonuclease RecJ [Nitrosomonas eutropha]SCX23496.1 exonuclease RecJ [Nitrosomonas eutropha]SDW09011.1 exonuclease RecJ [Nitrosomonas eutropha]SEI49358.1 exonuclease RecJ [Nitrosomonas eutropha]
MTNIIIRKFPSHAYETLTAHGLPSVLARIFAARGIEKPNQLDTTFSHMASFQQLKNIRQIAVLLADAIAAKKRLLVIADYDTDGATACAVALRALSQFGAVVDYLVPNRFEYGYGLTPEIVQLAANCNPPPAILITVDNGIASVEGVAEANRLGMQVFITDHHLPGDQLPEAAVIVNPNQPGCDFPDKHIAGVGVIFYVMLALRAELRERGSFIATGKEPNLANLLDLVALGTVADVVRLEGTNRILVQQGLQRIRSGHCCAGIHALFKVAGRDFSRVTTYELGFILAPRLNAAGRLDDMSLGIECLLAEDESRALHLASELDELNRQRREIEAGMQDEAMSKLEGVINMLDQFDAPANNRVHPVYSLCLYDSDWHQGVIGLIASRIKDRLHRPVIVFAQGNNGEIKGSGRSIPGLHLRDALDLVTKRHPGLIVKFGGHAMAAGLTVHAQHFEQFRAVFEQVAQSLLTPVDLIQVIETDGELEERDLTLELAQYLTNQVWGQGFPEPSFNGRFRVENQRIVGEKHLKLKLRKAGASRIYDGILFFHTERLPAEIDAVYRVQLNEYNGSTRMQLLLEHWFGSGCAQYG